MYAISLIPWKREADTGTALHRLRREMDDVFERFFREPFWPEHGMTEGRAWPVAWSPTLDVTESEDEVLVRAELPGVEPEKLDIQLSGDVLTLSGEKKEETEEKREDYYRAERRFGSFRRSIALPTSVNPDEVSAEFKNGVLTIKLQKSEVTQAKKIPVSTKK